MTSPFFGERWDAPVTEHAQQVPTPIGTPCGWCAMPIADGDQGKLIGSFDGPVPFHRECLLTSVVGSPAHLDGRCSCRGVAEEPLTPEQMRAEALEVWERVQSGGCTVPERRPRCAGAGWLCEAHAVPYDDAHREVCAGPGDACPQCNPAGEVDWLAVDTALENGPLQARDVPQPGTVPPGRVDHRLLQRPPVRALLIP